MFKPMLHIAQDLEVVRFRLVEIEPDAAAAGEQLRDALAGEVDLGAGHRAGSRGRWSHRRAVAEGDASVPAASHSAT